MPESAQTTLARWAQASYEAGFETPVAEEVVPPGLDEETVRLISRKQGEPQWMLDWRLAAYRRWTEAAWPRWSSLTLPEIDFQAISYYAAPEQRAGEALDPRLIETYERLGIPLREPAQQGGSGSPRTAVHAIFDAAPVATIGQAELARYGIVFCSLAAAVQQYPDLVRRYLGSVVPAADNPFAALNAAVFAGGTFVYIPEGVECPLHLSAYLRLNARCAGQFERTLIIAERSSAVSFLEGCTAPRREECQLHASVAELVARDGARIDYTTVQNWYPGDEHGQGGVFTFDTKRGLCAGDRSRIRWVQAETGAALNWKYPSCVLRGDEAVGEFYSVTLTRGYQQADTGTKMIHQGRNTRSHIVAKGIAADRGQQSYRGLVSVHPEAERARNYSQCDSMLMGAECAAHTFPYIDTQSTTAQVEHEATSSRISDAQLFYCKQRGIGEEDAVSMIVSGFCKEVLQRLPASFAAEAQRLLNLPLDQSVG